MAAIIARRRLAEIVNHDRAMAAGGRFGDDAVALTLLHCNRPQMQTARLIEQESGVAEPPHKTNRQKFEAWARNRARIALLAVSTQARELAEWAEGRYWANDPFAGVKIRLWPKASQSRARRNIGYHVFKAGQAMGPAGWYVRAAGYRLMTGCSFKKAGGTLMAASEGKKTDSPCLK
jgi:hypothetical protein